MRWLKASALFFLFWKNKYGYVMGTVVDKLVLNLVVPWYKYLYSINQQSIAGHCFA